MRNVVDPSTTEESCAATVHAGWPGSPSVSPKDLQPLKHPACVWLIPLCIVAPTTALAIFLMVETIGMVEDHHNTDGVASLEAAVNRYQITLVGGIACFRGLSHLLVRYMLLPHCAAFRNLNNSLQNQTVDMFVSFLWGPANVVMSTFFVVKLLSMEPDAFVLTYLPAARMYTLVLLVDQWFELASLKLHTIFDASNIVHHVGELVGAALTLEWLDHPFPGVGMLAVQQSYDRLARICFTVNRLIPRKDEALGDRGKIDDLIAVLFSSWVDEVTWLRAFGCYYALIRVAMVGLAAFYMLQYETFRPRDYGLLSFAISFFIVVDAPVYQWLVARMWPAKKAATGEATVESTQREPLHLEANHREVAVMVAS